ncbi:MATE family efflux transporter [Bacilli bacterium]|uniref:MATE family efflux transporter n=1 Tax=Oceanobacillus caeni TaxID=405946 RepID=UPI000DA982CF|nr:MATE family efflux transporter [Bacilli bacterium]PZD91336.1 MATE family efflux transporter [Bacilli bacterium]PZD92876.1 MATE family efflux transporter [Bacilli bacterium]RCO07623.1 MATE family efflux transporter [Bacilli bacterium]RCO08601.1 MATE family efflux transporter [Bacilli bacterium]
MMQTMEPRKLFMKYLIPSLFGMVLMAINILIDGLFVSHGVGEKGLAGVNIAVPIYSVILSVSLWIGMGGATLYSIALGQSNQHRAKEIFTHSIILAVLTTGLIIGFCLLFEEPLAYLFGANDSIISYVDDYLHIILLFGLVFVFENILSIFIRNDGNPTLAMAGLIVTSVVNIILNYLFIFIFHWGVKGAAYATVIGTFIGILVLLTHFLTRKKQLGFVHTKLDLSILGNIFSIGFPSFIVEGSTAVMMVAFNITFSHYVGETGVVAYAVVNYLHTVFLMLFIGIGAALQPITSYHYGAKLYQRMKQFIRIALVTGFGLGSAVFIIGLFGKGFIIDLFGIDIPEIINYTKIGIVYFFVGYLFLGINMVFVEYYQSIKKIRIATWIILSRSIILFIPLLWILPNVFGPNTIWLVFPVAEGLTVLFTFLVLKFKWVELVPVEMTQLSKKSG